MERHCEQSEAIPFNKRIASSFLLAMTFSFVFSIASAQFKGGVLLGVCASQVDGDNLGGYNKAGIKAGALVNRKLSEKIALQMEIEFSQKGSRKPVSDEDFDFYLMRLNYIEVPVLLQVQVGKKVSVEAGPSIATLISSYEEDTYSQLTGGASFHKFDYLVNGGVNYSISDHLIGNIRLSYSIVSIRTSASVFNNYYFNPGQYNNVIAFSMEYIF